MFVIIFLAVVGAAIGWITNLLAIKMLFRPIEPVRIPLLNISVQGLIPKRRNELAKSIGHTVENELLSIREIIEKLVTDDNKREVINVIKKKVIRVIDYKIPSIIPSSIKSKINEFVEEQIDKDADAILESTIQNLIDTSIQKIKIGEMVEKKIDEFEIGKLEEIILGIASKELKHIEILGGILGCIIGLVQGLLIRLI